MDYKQITDLIRLVNKTNIAEISIEEGDFKIRLRTADGIAARNTTTVNAAPVSYAPAPVAEPAAAPVAGSSAEEAATTEEPQGDYIEVRSPMVGTFYRRANPESDAFVSIGDNVAVGDVICVIEAMKLFNEIEAETSGKVVKVFPEDASPVEYDQLLFLIDPKG